MIRLLSLLTVAPMLVAPACGAPAPVAPAGVTVRVDDVASSNGQVMIALCDRASFMKRSCPIRGRVSAKRGSVAMRFNNVAPGDWAVQVFHDENGNGQLDRNGLGIPLEGVGFSRDAKGQYGPPTFDAAFVAVRGPIVIPVALAY